MIIALLFTIALAIYCASDDAKQIRRGVNIKHRSQWIIRAIVATVFVVCYFVLLKPTIHDALLMLVACGALFSTVFRAVLNTMTGKAWWYMGNSIDDRLEDASWYDGAWHWIAWKVNGGRYDGGTYRVYPGKLPATLATISELVVCSVCVAAVLI